MYHLGMWALILGLVFLNAFFVAAEFALVKVSVSRLLAKARAGSRAASIAVQMTERIDAYLSATQLGITLASLALGWMGEAYLNSLLLSAFHAWGIQAPPALTHTISFGIALAIITTLHLVWGELAPKNFAITRPDASAMVVALPLRAFYVAFYPFINALNSLANVSLRLFGVKPVSELEMSLSQEELRLAFAHAHSAGTLTAQERALMENVLLFAHMRARQIMLPRTDIFCVSVLDDLKENIEKILRSGHTRIPVVKHDLDEILGYVHIKDIAALALEPQPWNKTLQDFVRPVNFVSEHIALGLLLVYFQREQSHLAILVDEYGGTAGMATLENVLEQLVGAIRDEFDVEQPLIRRIGKGRFRIDARVPPTVVANRTKVSLPPTEADTIGGFVVEQLGEIPPRGRHIDFEGFMIVVTGANAKRLTSLELVLKTNLQESPP